MSSRHNFEMALARFPLSGPINFPKREDYLREAELLGRAGFHGQAEQFMRVWERLGYGPARQPVS
jgi:hypothetical protein